MFEVRTQSNQKKRALSLDLARGSMLFLIILSHVPLMMYLSEPGVVTKMAPGNAFESFINMMMEFFVDNRARPLFAVLFGYGVIMIYNKQSERRSIGEARRLILRRCIYLILFGMILTGVFWGQDILMVYGIAGIILLPFLGRSNKTLLIWTGATTFFYAVFVSLLWGGALFAMDGYSVPVEFTGEETYLNTIWARLFSIPFVPLFTHLMYPVIPSVLMGFWLGQLNVLINPGEHLPFLKKLMIITLSISIIGAIPLVLINDLIFPSYFNAGLIYGVHIISGLFAGLGYAALFGILGHKINAPNKITHAMAAMGKRSLTFFVLHEILIVVFLSPIAFDLGAHINITTGFIFAVLLWAVTLTIAYFMEQNKKNGLLEIWMRKLTYKT
ncbi:DUF418 domain-containing protein [Salinicoccus sp. Marseille-QA3877]